MTDYNAFWCYVSSEYLIDDNIAKDVVNNCAKRVIKDMKDYLKYSQDAECREHV